MRITFLNNRIIPMPVDIAYARKVRVIPNATQTMIAKYYNLDPFALTTIDFICDAKSVYAYVLQESRAFPTDYECADEAGVGYADLSRNKRILDQERNHNSAFGRQLDRFIYSHKKAMRNV